MTRIQLRIMSQNLFLISAFGANYRNVEWLSKVKVYNENHENSGKAQILVLNACKDKEIMHLRRQDESVQLRKCPR